MKTVTIYSTPFCPFCKALKNFLMEKGVPFKDKNVLESEELLEEMKKYSDGSTSVPVVVFNKDQSDQEVQIGYDQQKISQALTIS